MCESACTWVGKLSTNEQLSLLAATVSVVGVVLYVGKKYFSGGMVDKKLFQQANLKGEVCIVTGATYGGIGWETAKKMYELGCHVVLPVRNANTGTIAKEKIEELATGSKKGSVEVMLMDLNDLDSVKRMAEEFLNKFDRLDYLINNAGIMMCPHNTTKQGYEIQFGTNHLAHALLTILLLDLIKKSNGRIINVSSNGSYLFVNKEEQIKGFCSFEEGTVIGKGENLASVYQMYGRSKLANLLFSKKLAREFQKDGTTTATAYSLNPGAVKTNLGRHFNVVLRFVFLVGGSYFLKTPWEGTQTTLHLALAPKDKLANGEFYTDCVVHKGSPFGNNLALQDKLWETSMKLIKSYL